MGNSQLPKCNAIQIKHRAPRRVPGEHFTGPNQNLPRSARRQSHQRALPFPRTTNMRHLVVCQLPPLVTRTNNSRPIEGLSPSFRLRGVPQQPSAPLRLHIRTTLTSMRCVSFLRTSPVVRSTSLQETHRIRKHWSTGLHLL
jgi:hypothetical protein